MKPSVFFLFVVLAPVVFGGEGLKLALRSDPVETFAMLIQDLTGKDVVYDSGLLDGKTVSFYAEREVDLDELKSAFVLLLAMRGIQTEETATTLRLSSGACNPFDSEMDPVPVLEVLSGRSEHTFDGIQVVYGSVFHAIPMIEMFSGYIVLVDDNIPYDSEFTLSLENVPSNLAFLALLDALEEEGFSFQRRGDFLLMTYGQNNPVQETPAKAVAPDL